MNPQQPVEPSAPTPPQPQTSMPPQTPPTTPQNYNPNPIPPQKKSKKVLIWSIVGGIFALIVVVFGVLLAMSYPAIVTQAKADKFMAHMTKGEISEATAMTKDGSENKDFLKNMSEKVKDGEYKLKEKEYNSDDTSYYLFEIDGAEVDNARVTTKKESGTTYIDGFSVGNSLKLKSSKSSSWDEQSTVDTKKKEESSDKEEEAKTSSKCFSPSDYDAAFGWKNSINFTASSPHTGNVHFKGDSTDYAEENVAIALDSADIVADIVKNNPGKDYSITLTGGVASNDASFQALAQQRAQKIKEYLVSQGVDGSKITIGESTTESESSNEISRSMSRVVVIRFVPACNS